MRAEKALASLHISEVFCLTHRHKTKLFQGCQVLTQIAISVPFVRAAKALASLHIRTDSPGPLSQYQDLMFWLKRCFGAIYVCNEGSGKSANLHTVSPYQVSCYGSKANSAQCMCSF